MEAIDTVKPVLPHSESIWCPHCGEEFGIESHVEDERIMQAELSFKAGIREVVEWIQSQPESRCMDCITPYTFSTSAWQAELKRWGIEVKVFNKRKDFIPPNAVYVGRPSRWGNPFVVRVYTVSQYQAAVDYFRAYAEERLLHEPDWLEPLRGKDLVCWCSPLPCHADVLLELANR